MKNFQKKLLCGIFTASLVFTSGCITYTKDIGKLSSSTADSSYSSSSNDTSTSKYYTHLEHKDIPLSDRSRDSFDKDLFNSYCDNFKKALETSGNEETLTANYDLIKKELCNLSTDSFLALYDYYLDVDNEENSNISAKKDELYRNEFSNACSLFKEALSSDYADSFTEYIGSDLAESLADFTDLTDEENQLLDKQTELEQKYDSLSSADADYDQIKQLYIDIIKNNNEIANYYGCDNYAEYAYSQLYFRDFTIDDISSISDDVINNILPLFAAYCDDVLNNGTIDNIYIENTDTGNIKFSNLRSCIETISPELTASLDHLLKNNLYDVDYSKNKLSLGFTADLPSYNDGYIYYLPSYTLSDYSTIVHEFGHYNHIYNTESDIFNSSSIMDVQEIMSQGLQLLFYDYYDLLVGDDNGKALSEYTIYELLTNILTAFAVNEAEYNCYTEENLTVQKLDDIWNDAFGKYHLSLDEIYDSWTDISHVFTSPFYYISYGTSALASFEIFTYAQTDFDLGVYKYLTISALSNDITFTQALSAAGLKNIFDGGTISSLSASLADILDIKSQFNEYQNYINNSINQNSSGDTKSAA